MEFDNVEVHFTAKGRSEMGKLLGVLRENEKARLFTDTHLPSSNDGKLELRATETLEGKTNQLTLLRSTEVTRSSVQNFVMILIVDYDHRLSKPMLVLYVINRSRCSSLTGQFRSILNI